MRKCCFLSTGDLTGQVVDDDLTFGPLGDLGWSVETLSWHDNADWNSYDAVVIRTTWDYHRMPATFLNVLGEIDASRARLENPLGLVEWNIDKKYLDDLRARGVNTVPTIFSAASPDENLIAGWLDHFSARELILKPTVSANSDDTFRVTGISDVSADAFLGKEYMVQPFLETIVTEGEFSLFYFGGEYSHTVLKTPDPADFRVQQEHGGFIRTVDPGENLLAAGRKAIDVLPAVPLYARTDFVRDSNNDFLLMELELIEPSLYFRCSPNAAGHFARALNSRMNEL